MSALDLDARATLHAIERLVEEAGTALDDEAEGKFTNAVEGIYARARDLHELVSHW
jgi:hypothetical protein